MPKINQRSFRYAEHRLLNIKRAEWKELEKTFWIEPASAPITMKTFVEKVARGAIKLRKGKVIPTLLLSKNTRICDVFDIDVESRRMDMKKYNAALKTHEEKWQKIFDQLFLGDADEVMKLIADNEPKA